MNKGLILGLIKGKRDSWRINISQMMLSFVENFSFFSLAEIPPRDLQIIANK